MKTNDSHRREQKTQGVVTTVPLTATMLAGWPNVSTAAWGKMLQRDRQYLAILPVSAQVIHWRDAVRTMMANGVERILLMGNGRPLHVAPAAVGIIVTDHINVSGVNPLMGPNAGQFGPRFPDMSHAYDAELSQTIKRVAEQNALQLPESLLLAPKDMNVRTELEETIISQNQIGALSRDVFAGAIVAKHGNRLCAGVVFFETAPQTSVEILIRGAGLL